MMSKPESALVSRLYRMMLLIRRFEEKLVELYPSDAIKSPVHLSIGQESIAAGVCDVLNADDMISNTYRCHATHIAKGGDLNAMMAELYGKATGCAGGKAGSMHLVDFSKGIMGASAVVGTTIPVAAGYALALQREAKKTGKQRVVVAMCGDGATEEGSYLETVNFAVLHKLPILFVCENNGFAIHNPINRRQAAGPSARVEPYGMPMGVVEDGDVFAVREATELLLEGVRNGDGPAFLELFTYRWKEHVGPTNDDDAPYRKQDDLQQWKQDDQIAKLAASMPAMEVKMIGDEVEKLVQQSVDFAETSPYPGAEELLRYVYA
jgi:pyruvate dehydrogenase E1 component alpha subunit